MKTGSVMCVLVGEAGRDGGGELYKALVSAIVGSILDFRSGSDDDASVCGTCW